MCKECKTELAVPEAIQLQGPVTKTKVLKYSEVYPKPLGFFDRRAFAFQPHGASMPLLSLEEATEQKLAQIAGLHEITISPAWETCRRIHVVSERIFCREWNANAPKLSFSAEGLTWITSYVDAFPKPQGYDYTQVLKREAELLIPQSIENALDVDELLQSFFIWRTNRGLLHNPLLIVGLFLLFFRKVLELNFDQPFRYDLAVDTLMSSRTDAEIRREINRIIQQEI